MLCLKTNEFVYTRIKSLYFFTSLAGERTQTQTHTGRGDTAGWYGAGGSSVDE